MNSLKLKNTLLYTMLYLLPKNCMSCIVGRLIAIKLPKVIAVPINKILVRIFAIDLKDSKRSLAEFSSFQELFVRELRPGARIPSGGHVVSSPCDGSFGMVGEIDDGKLVQVKGKTYSLRQLLGDEDLFKKFLGGHFVTLYLSPRDYHRFHSPIAGRIVKTHYIPGTLWPVNRWAVKNIDNLFCQNERVISVMNEAKTGLSLAHIAVGATLVGRIDVNYVNFSNVKKCSRREKMVIPHDPVDVESGQELGKFMFGSTIVLLFEPKMIASLPITIPQSIKMGEVLCSLKL